MVVKKFLSYILILVLVFNPALLLAQGRQRLSINPNRLGESLLSSSLISDFTSNGQLSNLLKGNFDLSSFGQNVASINVHIVGDVQLPGTYKIPIGMRLSSILQAAIPKRPTFRFVQIERENRILSADYYKFINDGSLMDNPYLQDNDVIKVLGFAKAIRVEGSVSRPGVYEIGPEKTVADAIKLAGGFTSVYNETLPINVVRVTETDDDQQILPLSTNNIASTEIKANDIIVVTSPLNKNTEFDYSLDTLPGEDVFYPTSIPQVYVAGVVSTPGAYPYKKFMTVKDYLGFAGVNDNVKIRNPKVMRDNKLMKISMNDTLNPRDMIVVHKKDINQFKANLGVLSSILAITLTVIIIDDRLNN